MKYIGNKVHKYPHTFLDLIELRNSSSLISRAKTDTNGWRIDVQSAVGTTTFSTFGDNANDNHFEIAAAGSIILDSAAEIRLEPASGSRIYLDDLIAINSGVLTGATSITSTAFVGTLSTASQPNITGVGTITSGTWNGAVIAHAYIDNDAIDGDNIADDAVDSEHYTDGSIDTAHIADDQVTFAKASGVTPNVYGSIIKLLPTDFMDNGDGGNTKFGIGYTDSAGTGYGMRVPNPATEMYAFVSIPEGMKATRVDIYDKTNLAIEVFEVQIDATTMVSKGSGNCNTTLAITEVDATAKNMLAIEVTTTAVTDRIYGGQVTVVAQ